MTDIFVKEARLLNNLKHENIVCLIGVCDQPVAIMLEYCEFSFRSFNRDTSVNSLDKSLKYLAKVNLLSFFPEICHKIVDDIVDSIHNIHYKTTH